MAWKHPSSFDIYGYFTTLTGNRIKHSVRVENPLLRRRPDRFLMKQRFTKRTKISALLRKKRLKQLKSNFIFNTFNTAKERNKRKKERKKKTKQNKKQSLKCCCLKRAETMLRRSFWHLFSRVFAHHTGIQDISTFVNHKQTWWILFSDKNCRT